VSGRWSRYTGVSGAFLCGSERRGLLMVTNVNYKPLTKHEKDEYNKISI
jgi:hypothetical protein